MIAHTLHQKTLDHLKVNYFESGHKRTRATIILLSGIYNTHKLFYPLIEELDHDFHIIAPDLPGFGDSTCNRDFAPGDVPLWLDRLITALKLEDVYLLGHSLGGIYAISYAANHPKTVKGIVLIEAPIATRYIGRVFLNLINLCKNPDTLKLMMQRKDSLLVRDLIAFGMALPDVKYLNQHKADVVREIVSKTNYDMLAKYCSYLADYDVSDELRRLKIPVMAVYGGRDAKCIAGCASEFTYHYPGAEVHVFPHFNHDAQIAKTPLLRELILEFRQGV